MGVEHTESSFDAFLAELARAPSAPVQTEHLPRSLPSATVIDGRYRVERLVGHGGMGEVYLGFDESLGRPVALKIAQARLGSAAERRWRAEARALARLSHPNVVQVFRVGMEGGLPFIVMEWVPGRNLAEWAAERRRRWTEVVAMYQQAAEGLAAAHALGIVHRDFKPHNVLVGEDGRVRVADFGLAVADADEAPTPSPGGSGSRDTGGPIGTRGYVAPEVLDGRPADVRSDQFSFCAALCEALTGLLPPPTGEAPALGVPRWLMQIVRRGLDEDPARRHEDLASLARALDLKRRTVRSRRILAGYAVVAVVAVGLVSSLSPESTTPCEDVAAQLERVWSPERRDALSLAMTNTGSSMADGVTPKVVDALDAKAQHWAVLRQSVCEEGAASGDSAGPLGCLHRARVRFEATLEVLASPDRETVAHAQELVAAIGSPSDCGAAHRESGGDLASEDERELQRAIAEVDALRISGRVEQARDRADEVLSPAGAQGSRPVVAEALLARGLAHAAAEGRGSGVDDMQAAYWMATAHHQDTLAAEASRRVLQHLVTGPGAWDEAQRWSSFAEAAERRIGLVAPSWTLLSARANAAYLAQRFEPARRDYEAALKAADVDPTQRVALLNALTVLLIAEHRMEDALDRAREAVALAEQHLPYDCPSHAASLRNLGMALERIGERQLAIEALREAVAIRKRIFEPTSTRVTDALGILAEALGRAGRLDEALVVQQEALDLASSHQPPDWSEVANNLSGKGHVLFQLGRFDDAKAALERAVATHERAGGERGLARAFALVLLGNTLLELRDFEGTADAQTRALEIMRELLSPDSPQIAGALANRATALLLLQRPREASEDLDTATEILTVAGEERGALGSMVLGMRAEAHAQLGHTKPAVALALEALALDRELNPEPSPDLVRAHSTSADTLLHVGELDAAERVVQQGLAALDHLEPMDHLRGKLALDLAKIALARGDRDSSRRRCREAIAQIEDARARAEISAWCEANPGSRR